MINVRMRNLQRPMMRSESGQKDYECTMIRVGIDHLLRREHTIILRTNLRVSTFSVRLYVCVGPEIDAITSQSMLLERAWPVETSLTSASIGTRYPQNTSNDLRNQMILRRAQDCSMVWQTMSPASRAPYQAQAVADEERYNNESDAYKNQILLSPAVHISDGQLESESEIGSADEDYFDVWRVREDQRVENKRRLLEQRWNRYRKDHYKACGGALNPVPAEPFNFLGLPLEIRNTIYGLALAKGGVMQGSSHSKGPIDVRVFAVSRQVHAEAVEIFYRVNTFAVWIQEPEPLPLFVAKSTGMQVPRPTDLIRRIHLWILFPVMLDDPPLLDRFRTLSGVLSCCKNPTELDVTSSVAPA